MLGTTVTRVIRLKWSSLIIRETITPIAERLAVELSLPVFFFLFFFYKFGQSQLGLKHRILPLAGLTLLPTASPLVNKIHHVKTLP